MSYPGCAPTIPFHAFVQFVPFKSIPCCSWYLQSHGKALDADAAAAGRKHPHLGWAGIISFPHFFARCFGEYGNPQVGWHWLN